MSTPMLHIVISLEHHTPICDLVLFKALNLTAEIVFFFLSVTLTTLPLHTMHKLKEAMSGEKRDPFRVLQLEQHCSYNCTVAAIMQTFCITAFLTVLSNWLKLKETRRVR